jgi:hypothetical protein
MLQEIIRFVSPGWINDPTRLHWRAYFDTVAAVIDALISIVEDTCLASMPGQVDGVAGLENLNGFWQVDALKYIGEDRMVLRGLAESPADYALALRRYRDDWKRGASVFGMLQQLARVLTTTGNAAPLLRAVNGNGDWHTLHPDGTMRLQRVAGDGFFLSPDGTSGPDTTVAHAWDWDSASLPAPFGKGDATRFWVIIYCPTNLPYLASISGQIGDGRKVGAKRGTPDAATIGTCAPEQHVELVRAVVQQRRAAGYRCSHLIEAFDPTSFNPDGSSALYPDGTWGWPCKSVAGVMTPTRDLSARYGRAEPGRIAGSS